MPRRKIYIAILISIFILLGILVGANFLMKSKIAKALNSKLPTHINLSYDELKVNVLSGSVDLHKVAIALLDPNSGLVHTSIDLEAMHLKGLGYFNLLINKEVVIRELELQQPEIAYTPHHHTSKKASKNVEVVDLEYKIILENLSIKAGKYTQLQQDSDRPKLAIDAFNLSLRSLELSRESLAQSIPFSYQEPKFVAQQLSMDLSTYETLHVAKVAYGSSGMGVLDFAIKSKYGKKELSRVLTVERDHINLLIPELQFSDLDFGFNKKQLYLHIGSASMKAPNLELYRDKLIGDDLKHKRLYSQMLRELPLQLHIDQLVINKGLVSYAEKVTEGVAAGEIIFSDLNADISQVSNIEKNAGKVKVQVRAKLMREADLQLDWSFEPQNESDAFLVSGRLLNMKANSINPFLSPNLRAEAKGAVEELYFTFSGDEVSASGDMKMKYRDFKFVILQKDRTGVNKLLTAIGNIFTNDGSNADPKGYRYGTIYAQRDPTKSFFNYLWQNVKEGVISTLTGNGEKD